MLIRIAAVFAALASPVWADCVTFDSTTKGITVTQPDGSVWTVQRGAREGVRMDLTNVTGVYAKHVRGLYGGYPTESTRNGIGSTAEYAFAKAPPEPTAGMDWASNYKINDIPHC